jgi:hypothetical protein
LLEALGLVFVGFLIFAIVFAGANFMKVAHRLPTPRTPHGAELVTLLVLLLLIGWTARLLLIQRGFYFRYGSAYGSGRQTAQFSTLLGILSNLPLIAFALVTLERMRVSRWRMLSWTVLALELGWALPSGERARIVGLGLVLLLNRYYGDGGRFPTKAVVVGVLLVVFVVFPFGALYRGAGGASGYQTAPVSQLEVAARQLISHPSALPTMAFDETFSRFSDIASVATITTQGRRLYPRSGGQTLRDWRQSLVPRFIAPGKSDPGTIGNDFGRSYNIIYRTSPASISTTYVGDLYGSFGIWGTLVGMAALGALTRGLDEYLRDRRSEPLILAIYATMVGQFLLRQETSVAVGFIQSLKDVFIYVLVTGAIVWAASVPGRARRDAFGIVD